MAVRTRQQVLGHAGHGNQRFCLWKIREAQEGAGALQAVAELAVWGKHPTSWDQIPAGSILAANGVPCALRPVKAATGAVWLPTRQIPLNGVARSDDLAGAAAPGSPPMIPWFASLLSMDRTLFDRYFPPVLLLLLTRMPLPRVQLKRR